jgi:hypothetical protein
MFGLHWHRKEHERRRRHHHHRAATIQFITRVGNVIKKGENMVNLTPALSAYDIVVTGELDASGNPVTLPTVAFQFAVNDPTLGIFTVNADGKSGTFVANAAQTVSSAGFITITDPIVGITTQSHFTFTVAPPPPPPVAATIQFSESTPHAAV